MTFVLAGMINYCPLKLRDAQTEAYEETDNET